MAIEIPWKRKRRLIINLWSGPLFMICARDSEGYYYQKYPIACNLARRDRRNIIYDDHHCQGCLRVTRAYPHSSKVDAYNGHSYGHVLYDLAPKHDRILRRARLN